ncbi:MAG: AAC(3) family N-acetyltransferase [Spirochaetaceae bacterium]|nr:AAC(3) family N-acetyltransferase [Spirochaetaceae bacterium]
MKEADIIAKTDEAFGGPLTSDTLIADLRALGPREGDVLLVHSSLSAVGWISGGAETLIRALLAAVGESGTLAMPAHSGALSDPGLWENPPVPASWQEPIRNSMPPYDPALTATRGIGIVPELFRQFPGVLRSSHPRDSFCALGPQAEQITANQMLENGLGEAGPLARLYDLNARVLLVGCGHDSNSSLHLAEYRAEWPGKKKIRQGCPMIEEGRRIWKWFEEVDLDIDDFPACGKAFEENTGGSGSTYRPDFAIGKIGLAESRLMSHRALVDFASGWFETNRGRGMEPEASV